MNEDVRDMMGRYVDAAATVAALKREVEEAHQFIAALARQQGGQLTARHRFFRPTGLLRVRRTLKGIVVEVQDD